VLLSSSPSTLDICSTCSLARGRTTCLSYPANRRVITASPGRCRRLVTIQTTSRCRCHRPCGMRVQCSCQFIALLAYRGVDASGKSRFKTCSGFQRLTGSDSVHSLKELFFIEWVSVRQALVNPSKKGRWPTWRCFTWLACILLDDNIPCILCIVPVTLHLTYQIQKLHLITISYT